MEKILKVLEGIELNEDQIKAFDEFFTEFTENVKNETSEVYQEELDKLEGKVSELTEGKYSPENVEKAFELYKEDISKENSEVITDLKEEMATQLAESVQSVYEDIEARVKQDVSQSKEMQIIENIKSAIAPLMVKDESLVEEVNSLQEELQTLKGQKAELTREKTIATLLEDIPAEFNTYVRNFISEGKTEDEIYERFETLLPIIEMKIKNIDEDIVDEEVDEEEIVDSITADVDSIDEDDIEDAISENVIFKSDTSKSVIAENIQNDTKQEKDEEEDMLALVYANSRRPYSY